jgi:hypothetical protein
MGSFFSSLKYVNFENIQNKNKNTLIINTLHLTEQICLIKGTIPADQEEQKMNDMIRQRLFDYHIILYGKNNNDDDNVIKKYKQLKTLGFTNIYIYKGGLFEWLLLQDIYGNEEFPTTYKENDILKFKPQKLNIN